MPKNPQRAEPFRKNAAAMQSAAETRETADPAETHETVDPEAQALKVAEARERRSVVRALLLLAVVVLLASMARAGWGRVFVHDWWRW